MKSLNECFLSGNLTRDPEIRPVGDKTQVVNFTLAVNKTHKKDGKEVNKPAFVDCEAWDTAAETIAKWFGKGDYMTIRASVTMDSWEDKQTGAKRSKIKFRVNEFFFPPKGTNKAKANKAQAEEQPTDESEGGENNTGGDIPF